MLRANFFLFWLLRLNDYDAKPVHLCLIVGSEVRNTVFLLSSSLAIEKSLQVSMSAATITRSVAGSKMRAQLQQRREEKEASDRFDQEMEKHNKLIQQANDALVENKLRTLVLSLHLGDDYPLRPRYTFVPPLTEGFLPIIDPNHGFDTHFFLLGSPDNDYKTIHHCNPKQYGNNRQPPHRPRAFADTDVQETRFNLETDLTQKEEQSILVHCATKIWKQEINNYDVVVMTDNENQFLDAVLLTQRMQYIAGRPLQYKQGWGNVHSLNWAVTTSYLKTAVGEIQNKMFMPGTPYLIPLPNRGERERRRVRNQMRYENGVTFHINQHLIESRHRQCVHPVALIMVINRMEDIKVADAIRTHIKKTLTCHHEIILVDNGNLKHDRWRGRKQEEQQIDKDHRADSAIDYEEADTNNNKNIFISVRLHAKRSLAYAMKMGIRAVDALGKLKRRPFDAYGFIDVERIDFVENALHHGWLSTLMTQMLKLDAGKTTKVVDVRRCIILYLPCLLLTIF